MLTIPLTVVLQAGLNTFTVQLFFNPWSDLPVVYLFLDGQYHAARQGTDENEGVLSAYALLEDGRPGTRRLYYVQARPHGG